MRVEETKAGLEKEEADLVFYAKALWKRRWGIIIVEIVALVTALLVSVTSPTRYEATAIIRSASDIKFFLGLTNSIIYSLLGPNPIFRYPKIPEESPSTLIVRLKSREMMSGVVKHFNLVNHYHVRSEVEAREILTERTRIRDINGQLIEISVEDTEPKFTMEMINHLVSQLDSNNRSLHIKKVRERRKLLERLLDRIKSEMDGQENAFRDEEIGDKKKLRDGKLNLRNDLEVRKDAKFQVLGIKKKLYDSLIFVYGESVLAEESALDKGWTTIELIEPAYLPNIPKSPQIEKNLIVTGILTFFIVTFGIFLDEYLKKQRSATM